MGTVDEQTLIDEMMARLWWEKSASDEIAYTTWLINRYHRSRSRMSFGLTWCGSEWRAWSWFGPGSPLKWHDSAREALVELARTLKGSDYIDPDWEREQNDLGDGIECWAIKPRQIGSYDRFNDEMAYDVNGVS